MTESLNSNIGSKIKVAVAIVALALAIIGGILMLASVTTVTKYGRVVNPSLPPYFFLVGLALVAGNVALLCLLGRRDSNRTV
jgi:hypothetical protein